MKEPFKILAALFIGSMVLRTIYIPSVKIFGVYPQIDNVFSLLFLFYVISNSIKKPGLATLNLPVRYAFYFMVFYLIIFNGYILIKDIIFHDESFSILIKRTLRDLINLHLILFIIHYSRIVKFKQLMIKTVIGTLIILIVSSIFSKWFLSMGFIPSMREIHGIDRNTGFLGMNPNGASVFYNIILGFGLAELESKSGSKQKMSVLLLIGLSVLGVILMVSKTGFIILIALTLFFLYRNMTKVRFFIKEGILVLGLIAVIYIWKGDTMTTRVQYQFSGKEDTYSTRMSYNEVYLGKIFSDPSLLWYGRTDQYKPLSQNPHNLLVFTFYYGGIFFVLILVFLYLRMLWFTITVRYRIYGYVLLPVIMGSLSGFTDYSLWFPMFVGLIYVQGDNTIKLK